MFDDLDRKAVEAGGRALCQLKGHRTRRNDPYCPESGEQVRAVLLAASEVIDCPGCKGRGKVRGPAHETNDRWMHAVMFGAPIECPACGGSGSLRVLLRGER